jgi:hypothetical protein
MNYAGIRVRHWELPFVLCPWCKERFKVRRSQLDRIFMGGQAFCSPDCSNRYRMWLGNRGRR